MWPCFVACFWMKVKRVFRHQSLTSKRCRKTSERTNSFTIKFLSGFICVGFTSKIIYFKNICWNSWLLQSNEFMWFINLVYESIKNPKVRVLIHKGTVYYRVKSNKFKQYNLFIALKSISMFKSKWNSQFRTQKKSWSVK